MDTAYGGQRSVEKGAGTALPSDPAGLAAASHIRSATSLDHSVVDVSNGSAHRGSRRAPSSFLPVLDWDGLQWVRGNAAPNADASPAFVAKNYALTHAAVSQLLVLRYRFWTSPNDLAETLRSAGIDVPRSAVAKLLRQAASHLAPLAEMMRGLVCDAPIVAAANGPVGHGTIKRLWVYVGLPTMAGYESHGDVVTSGAVASFRLTLDRLGGYAAQELNGFQGCLFASPDSGYDGLFARPTVQRIGCWSEIRSIVAKLDHAQSHPVSVAIQRLIEMLRMTEKDLGRASPDQRLIERRARISRPMSRVHASLANARRDPGTPEPMRRFAGWLHDDWAAHSIFLDDGRVGIGCLVATDMIDRYGERRGWVFGRDHESHVALADMATILETCQLNGIAPVPYLTAILSRADQAEWPMPWAFS